MFCLLDMGRHLKEPVKEGRCILDETGGVLESDPLVCNLLNPAGLLQLQDLEAQLLAVGGTWSTWSNVRSSL